MQPTRLHRFDWSNLGTKKGWQQHFLGYENLVDPRTGQFSVVIQYLVYTIFYKKQDKIFFVVIVEIALRFLIIIVHL